MVAAEVLASHYLMQRQRVAIARRDGVDRGVESQPAPAAQVEPADGKAGSQTQLSCNQFPFYSCFPRLFFHTGMHNVSMYTHTNKYVYICTHKYRHVYILYISVSEKSPFISEWNSV